MAGRGRSPSPKGQRLQGSPQGAPKLEQLPCAAEGAPRTFLLRNSLTREAATSSTKRLSILLALPTRPRPRSPSPPAGWPVWPRCRGDVFSALEAPPLPPELGGGRAGRGGASSELALQREARSARQKPWAAQEPARASRPGSWLKTLSLWVA